MVNKIEMIGVLFTFKICAAQSTQKHMLRESDGLRNHSPIIILHVAMP